MDDTKKYSIIYSVIALLLICICEARDKDGIKRPCLNNNLSCIQKYFSTHGHCEIPLQESPESVVLPSVLKVPFPFVNTTAVYDSLIVNNFAGKIRDFYVNGETDNAVLTVDFYNLRYDVPKLTYLFHRVGLEPVRVSDFLGATFTLVTATATIPDIENLQMKDAIISAYTEDAFPNYTLGPKIVNNIHRDIADYVKTLLSDMPLAVRQFLDTTMPFTLQSFVKYKICDFDATD